MLVNETPEKPTLYEGVAQSLTHLIESGTFQEGQRLPSIRDLSRQFGVSVNTVREAYGVLEVRRMIDSRPQSGYFVRRRAGPPASPNPVDWDVRDPHEVLPCAVREEYPSLVEGKPYQGLALAKAAPDTSLFPTRRLNAFLGAVSREAGTAIMDYDTQRGLPELREAVARTSMEAGLRLAPDDFLITGGCMAAIAMVIDVLCRTGDTIAVESPTYSEFLKLFKSRDLRVLEIPTSTQEGMNLEVLEWALERHPVKAVLSVPTFNNPSAFTMPDHRKKALVEILAARGIPLIEDDAYGELAFCVPRPLACKAFDTSGSVIYCSSVSKTVSPGYRVGWIAGGRWQDAILQRKISWSASASLPAQLAVARYLSEGNYSRHLRTLTRRLSEQSKAIAELVVKHFPAGTTFRCPDGGLFLWIELPKTVDTEKLYALSVPEGIFFRPGVVFSAMGQFSHCLRLGTGTWDFGIEAAVVRLGTLACGLASRSQIPYLIPHDFP